MKNQFSTSDVFTWHHESTDCRELEIVIPVKNEANRIGYLIKNLIGNFKLVFLDGGSTDGTLDIIKSYDCDILLRNDPYKYGYGFQKDLLAQKIFDAQNGTSWCLAYYINYVSKAKIILRLWADEYINREEQQKLVSHYSTNMDNITGVRIDWFYGHRLGPVAKYPLSFKPGEAVWDDKVLHSDLLNISDESKDMLILVEHFSLCDTVANASKWARYTVAELERITEGKKFRYLPVSYRYGLKVLVPVKQFYKYKSLKLFTIALMLQIMDCIMGHILYFELNSLPCSKMQNEIYKHYAENN